MDVSKIFKKYDPKDEAKWKEFKGMKFLIAPAGNTAYKNATLKNLTMKQAVALETQGPEGLDMQGDEALAKIYKIYADSVVCDWDEVKEGNKKLNFSKDKILEWMLGFDEFANFVVVSAHEVRSELSEVKEEVEKN